MNAVDSFSPPLARSSGVHSSSPETASSSYAFLVHSAATLPNNLPPTVDDKPLARQKRKRTSPEDQAVLEAAYKLNPKPDRTARLELVNTVALGEKEVQIWFQNRRQSSRRKSRPLLPHEIAQYSSSFASSAVPSSGSSKPETPDMENTHSSDAHAGEVSPSMDPALKPEGTSEPASMTSGQDDQYRSGSHVELDPVETAKNTAASHVADEHDLSQLLPPSQDSSSMLGYLANRRSAPFLRPSHEEPYVHLPVKEPELEDSGSARRLKKTSSFVRLSMTSEGNAKVITADSSTPSPPRPLQTSQHPMYSRDNSSTVSLSQRSAGTSMLQILHRSTSGRSRDSRAWEFWCDKDARGELEEKAEQERSGSAADAIGLLRSASGRSILGAIPSKRNSWLMRQSSAKRSKLDDHRPPLHRSSSSFGRLQGDAGARLSKKATPRLKYSGSAVSVYIPGNESDKENWSPDRDFSSGNDQPPQEQPALRGEPYSGQVNKTRSPRKQLARLSQRDVENIDPEKDEELSAFMRKGRTSTSMSDDEDLDCVQGLLSLSQGNWR